jgi:hypothetical protein
MSFLRTDTEFSTQAKKKAWNDGTTAVIAVIDAERIYCGNGMKQESNE